MKVLKVVDEHTSKEIKKLIRSYKGYNNVIDWKIIQSVQTNPGITAQEISKVLCISVQKVYSVIEEYNRKGKDYKKEKNWGGRRKGNYYLSIEEEKEFLNEINLKATKGLIHNAKDAKVELEKKLKHPVSEDYIWKVFRRHKWTKKTPRPEHPNTDMDKQEEFKKNSRKTWQPPS